MLNKDVSKSATAMEAMNRLMATDRKRRSFTMTMMTRRFPTVDITKMRRYAAVLAISVAVTEEGSEPTQKLVLLNIAVWKNKAH